MKIGVISSAYAIPTPPKLFGGMERITGWISDELVKRGHDVTLFGCTGSSLEGGTVVELPGGGEVFPQEGGGEYPRFFQFMVDWMGQQTTPLDVFHDSSHHHEFARRLPSLPSISTIHNPNSPESKNPVFISHSHRVHLGFPDAPYVLNGCPEGEYDFRKDKDDYVLFMGVFGHHKGFDIAVDFAKQYGVPLKLAGFPGSETEIKILDSCAEYPNIQFLGVVGGQEKNDLLSHAKAVLMPFRWPEPGCILAVEAMASGTPIIGTTAGVLPEYISHGNTGFVIGHSTEEIWNAYNSLGSINSVDCFERYLSHYTIQRVVDQYELLYERAMKFDDWNI